MPHPGEDPAQMPIHDHHRGIRNTVRLLRQVREHLQRGGVMAHKVFDKLARTRYAPLAPCPIVGPLTNNSRGEARALYRDEGCSFRGVLISEKCVECPLSQCRYDGLGPAIEFVKAHWVEQGVPEYNTV